MRLVHTVTIERATPGADDDRGVPAQTWAPLATVPGWLQPRSAREVAQLSQSGPVASTHVAYLLPQDITEADRIAFGGATYQIAGIRDAAGYGHHLEVDLLLAEGV